MSKKQEKGYVSCLLAGVSLHGGGPVTDIALIETENWCRASLQRLRRALLLRFYAGSLLSASDRRLLDWVIYSTFCDCQYADVDSEARRLLNEARAGIGLFGRPPSRLEGT